MVELSTAEIVTSDARFAALCICSMKVLGDNLEFFEWCFVEKETVFGMGQDRINLNYTNKKL